MSSAAAAVRSAPADPAGLAALAALADLKGKGVLSGATAHERTLPVLPEFEGVLPGAAVQRGSIIGCHGPTAVSLALALAAGPSAAGAWVGVAGLPHLGAAAAGELGVVLERLVVVREPVTGFDDRRWGEVLAAMVDGFDVVVLGPALEHLRPGTARRVASRLQARGAVAIVVAHSERSGVFVTDLRLEARQSQWEGLGAGHGVACSRRTVVELAGRRVPRPRRCELLLPGGNGRVHAALPAPASLPLHRAG